MRCRAEIWAQEVQYRNGKYVSVTGWTFNNLSYLPSPRASWAGNNLARTNAKWTSGGRTWQTECDTLDTGRGGCRSYVWTSKMYAAEGGFYRQAGWAFNGLVLFSSPSVPAVTKAPGWIIDQSPLEPTGLGPIRIDTDAKDLKRLGYVRKLDNGACEYWDTSKALKNRGVGIEFGGDDVYWVGVDKVGIRTEAGARVGMTVGQVKAIYGVDFTVVPKINHGVTQYFGTVRDTAFELQFRVKGTGENSYAPTGPLRDSDVIAEISAQRYTDDVSGGGC